MFPDLVPAFHQPANIYSAGTDDETLPFFDACPDSWYWSQIEKEQFFIEIICRTWQDVIDMLTEKITSKDLTKNFQQDYEATLGWLLGYWIGAIPLHIVLQYENDSQKNVYEGKL